MLYGRGWGSSQHAKRRAGALHVVGSIHNVLCAQWVWQADVWL